MHLITGSLDSVVSNLVVINCQVRISAQRSAIANDILHFDSHRTVHRDIFL